MRLILVLFLWLFLFILNHKYKLKINSCKKEIRIEEDKYKNCYISEENKKLKVMHIVITRFLLKTPNFSIYFNKLILTEKYIQNGIRVLKKYLIPSLENQICKNFTWVLMVGDQVNSTYVTSLIGFNFKFKSVIIYYKDFENYINDISKNLDVLISTRIDYDDIIYNDAVNDVRKSIDINKPLLLYGYKRGYVYLEKENIYFEVNINYKNNGALAIFLSLITVLNKVNKTLTIFNIGDHRYMRNTLLKNYKKYGLNELNYEPVIFDERESKYVYVRQNYSHSFGNRYKFRGKKVIFDLDKFYGKKDKFKKKININN